MISAKGFINYFYEYNKKKPPSHSLTVIFLRYVFLVYF